VVRNGYHGKRKITAGLGWQMLCLDGVTQKSLQALVPSVPLCFS